MQILPSQIFIYPFTLSTHGQRFNTFEYGLDDTDFHGWNVQAFGLLNGTACVIDDGDFTDLNAAYAYAHDLSQQYQIPIDCMEDAPTTATVHHDPAHHKVGDDLAQIMPALAA